MAIRDRFLRALRRSDVSSSDTISQADSTSTTTSSTRQSSNSESPSPLKKTSSTLSRTFAFGRRDKDKEREKEKAKEQERERRRNKNRRWTHPSEKPLTAQNLKHQEMLGQFTMTFGTRNLSQIYDFDCDGVSPCCTRPPSIDGGSR